MPKENIQQTFQDLYARAKNHEVFIDLMPIVLNRENILLAYRNIKSNSGSDTPGTDGLTINDIKRLTVEKVIDNVNHSKLIRQMWTLGIRDKHLLGKIRRILKAPVKLTNGKLLHPRTGTPQGGIVSRAMRQTRLKEMYMVRYVPRLKKEIN